VRIDATHRRWFLAAAALGLAAVLLENWWNRRAPGGGSGGDLMGLGFGLAGFALMTYAAALSLLRRVPSWWWLGARKTWLRGHVWLGSLSGVLILCHSGFRFGGPLETVLMILLFLTLGTGVVGLVVQQVVPPLLTARVPCEAPYGQIPHLCAAMRRAADALLAAAHADTALDPAVTACLGDFYRQEVRPFLAERYDRAAPLAEPARAEAMFARLRALPGFAAAERQLTRLQTCCEERRQLGEQARLHRLLHGWLFLHVPLSAALILLGLAHAVLSLYY
jgi:vacuolar-type H+-ATPase subunit I/STV1